MRWRGDVRLLAAAVCLCAWELGSLQAVPPLRLEPPHDHTVLEPGHTLAVRCWGVRPVTWNFTSLAQDISSRVTITGGETGDADYPYTSRLEIRNVSYLDVGYQTCSFAGTTSLENTARLYLYVNDSQHLLVYRRENSIISVRQNTEAVIPCRVSHPDVHVTLNKDGRQVWPGDDLTTSYDSRRGFVLENTQSLRITGLYICVPQQDWMQLASFHVLRATESVQQPEIDRTDARNAVLGNNFTLVCRVGREPGQRLELSWTVPPASTGLKTGRIEQLPEMIDGETVIRRLLVTDTRPEDEGQYACDVLDHNGHTNSRQENISVYSPDTASVELSTDTRQFLMHAGRSVKIVVNIDAHPSPMVVWYGPDNQPMDDRTLSSTPKHIIKNSLDQTILQVFNLQLDDSGQYKVSATSPNGTASDSLVFNVTVQDRPLVRLGEQPEFFTAGRRYTLPCSATGYPTPNVAWRFKDCAPEPCDRPFLDLNETEANDEEELQLQSSPFLVQSDLAVTATRSGFYKCRASSAYPGTDEAIQRFFVTDIEGGFGIVRPEGQVVEGDSLNMTCGGSQLAFSGLSSFSWYWSTTDNGQLDPVTEGEGVRVLERTTDYSYQKVLELDRVRLEQSGLYLCLGHNTRNIDDRAQTRLRVVAARIPMFTESANMDQSVSLRLEEGARAELNCTVTGRPEPAVNWTKDGAPLKLDRGERVRLVDGGQRLVISAALVDDAGNYECRAVNREGTLIGSAELVVPGDDFGMRVVGALTGVFLLCLVSVVACLVWKCRQQKKLQRRLTRFDVETFANGKMGQFNPALPIDEQAELLPYDEAWEFPKERLVLGRQIGSGAFGRVLKAEAIGLTAQQQRTVVAVKMPKSGSDPDQIRSLMAELKIMIQLGKHLNVVNLLGAVTKHAADGEFMVLVEYCRHGNLHQYLHRHKNSFINQIDPISGEYDPRHGEEEFQAAMHQAQTSSENTPLNYVTLEHGQHGQEGGRLTITSGGSYYRTPRRGSMASSIASAAYYTDNTGADSVCQSPTATGDGDAGRRQSCNGTMQRQRRTPLTTRDLLRWSYQVARGMEYLASRKLLHGDLAARNILLAEDSIVKISDFGLSRDIYKTRDYKKKGKGLLPVKWMAIESIQESIFSTQSDVWAFGVVMWEFFSLGATPYPGMEYDVNFVRRLRDGYRMELPKFSPNSTYRLMMECWQEMPGDRPSFTEISEKLGQSLEDHVKKEYMQLNEPFNAMNEEYFSRRTDYVQEVISPDYQNVPSLDRSPDDDGGDVKQDYVNVFPRQQLVGYVSPGKGGRDLSTLADADSYLLMSPQSEPSPDGVFSPRPTAVVRPSCFEFPPAPQLAPPPGFCNPSYQQAVKPVAAAGRVPSTPKMGTRVARGARPADSRGSSLPPADQHYRCPVPVGCEQLA